MHPDPFYLVYPFCRYFLPLRRVTVKGPVIQSYLAMINNITSKILKDV